MQAGDLCESIIIVMIRLHDQKQQRGIVSPRVAMSASLAPSPMPKVAGDWIEKGAEIWSKLRQGLKLVRGGSTPPPPSSTADRQVEPSSFASLWSRLIFSWVNPLMSLGNEKALEMDDLWRMQEKHSMTHLSAQFQKIYTQELEVALAHNRTDSAQRLGWTTSPMIRTLWRLYDKQVSSCTVDSISAVNPRLLTYLFLCVGYFQLLWTGFLRLASSILQFAPPILVRRLLLVLEAGVGMNVAMGYQLTWMLVMSLVIKTALENQFFHYSTRMSMQLKGLIATAVYRKALKLSPSARQRSTVGEIVNMMQLDAARLENVASSLHTTWTGAMDILGYTALLLACMGPSMFVGIAIMILIIPVNAMFLGFLAKARERTLKFTDARVKLTNEVLQGIRSIKSYAWESAFVQQVGGTSVEKMRLRGELKVSLTPALS